MQKKKDCSEKTISEMGYLYVYRELVLKGFLVLLVIVSMFGGCSYINSKLGIDDDGFVEEILEGIIKQKIGLKIDLTPESPE